MIQKHKLFNGSCMAVMLTSLLLCTPLAFADNVLATITDQFANAMQSWQDPLTGYASTFFWLLAGIEMVWVFGSLMLKRADFGDWIETVCMQLMVIGFFWAFLTHSSEWATAAKFQILRL